MNTFYRALFFRTFVLFFLIIIPFLVLFTLGYDLNFNKNSLSQSLLISVDTIPKSALVNNKGTQISTIPAEISTQNDKTTKLEISEPGFYTEKFSFFSKSPSNSVAKISSLTMMPERYESLSSPASNQEFISLLNDNLLLLKEKENYFLKTYSFGGAQNKNIEISNPDAVILINNYNIDLGGVFWFPDSKAIMLKNNNAWELKNLAKFPFSVADISKKDDSLVLLNSDNQLWIYDINTRLLRFVESNVNGLSMTKNPNILWVLKGKEVYRYDENQSLLVATENDKPSFVLEQSLTGSVGHNTFEVANVYQGIAFRYGDVITYIPDFDKSKPFVVASGAKSLYAVGSVIFWLDKDSKLTIVNLELKSETLVTGVDLDKTKPFERVSFFYYVPWKRLFIYSDNKDYTMWYDKDTANSSIIRYYPQLQSSGSCLPLVLEKNQFCIESGSLVSYRNLKLW